MLRDRPPRRKSLEAEATGPGRWLRSGRRLNIRRLFWKPEPSLLEPTDLNWLTPWRTPGITDLFPPHHKRKGPKRTINASVVWYSAPVQLKTVRRTVPT
jgi:hypothetical protein